MEWRRQVKCCFCFFRHKYQKKTAFGLNTREAPELWHGQPLYYDKALLFCLYRCSHYYIQGVV
jgi:hypothetical protein